MSSTLRVTNVSGVSGGTSTNLMSGLAKAWSNLNGTGTIAERDSFNISGYVDNATGHYTFTIANDMSNANYIASGLACDPGTTSGHIWSAPAYADGNQVAGSLSVATGNVAGTAVTDMSHTFLDIHGDLA